MSSNFRNRERDTDGDDDNRPSAGPRGGDRRPSGNRRGGHRRRKVCRFCLDKVDIIDFKDVRLLQSYIPERGKIMPRRISGSCASHQRMLNEAIKRARNIALLPYAAD